MYLLDHYLNSNTNRDKKYRFLLIHYIKFLLNRKIYRNEEIYIKLAEAEERAYEEERALNKAKRADLHRGGNVKEILSYQYQLTRKKLINKASYVFIIFTTLLITPTAMANELQLEITEKITLKSKKYLIDIDKLTFKEIESIQGSEIPQINKYTVQNHKLVRTIALSSSDEILYQCSLGEYDIVIVWDEFISYFGCCKILFALIGHPVQVSKIMILIVSDNQVINWREITRKEDSWGWIVKIYE